MNTLQGVLSVSGSAYSRVFDDPLKAQIGQTEVLLDRMSMPEGIKIGDHVVAEQNGNGNYAITKIIH